MIQELSDAKRLLELEVAHLKQQLFGPRSEKLPLEDRQLPLLEQLFESPEPPATEDVVVSVEVETPKTEGHAPWHQVCATGCGKAMEGRGLCTDAMWRVCLPSPRMRRYGRPCHDEGCDCCRRQV